MWCEKTKKPPVAAAFAGYIRRFASEVNEKVGSRRPSLSSRRGFSRLATGKLGKTDKTDSSVP
jgi:hypothetical protein